MKRVITIKKQECISPLLFIIILFAFIYVSFAQTDLTQLETRLKNHITYLASDSLQGRFAGKPGNELAMNYIKEHFKEYGATVVAGSYFQSFPFVAGLKLDDNNNSMEVSILVEKMGIPTEMLKPTKRKWELYKDWKPMRFSQNGTVAGEIAFVGYGITSKELNYDDYAGIDVKNKIVIILSDSAEGQCLIKEFKPYAELSYKVNNAREHGASGIIFIKTLSDSANTYYKFYPDKMFKNSGVIAIQGNRTQIAKLFPHEKPMLDLEKKINKEKIPQSFILPKVTLSITVNISEDIKQINNVLGMVKGTDPNLSDEFFIVGAHFDHLGWGEINSFYKGKTPQIHHGADDNASGVSALLELSSIIKEHPLRRSVLFISFNAEELGLQGSAYYVKNPIIPLEKTDFMLNMDMIGRMKDNRLNLMGTGSSTRFSNIADSLAITDSIKIIKVTEAYGPSDHASFYSKNIPVMMMFTDLHLDYHRPTDEVDKINFEGLARLTLFAEHVLRAVDSYDTKPDYQVIKSADTSAAPKERGYGKVWFGVVPDFEENPKGLKITGTAGGSPAQKAGLQNGDIITRFGDKTVKNLYDLTYCLKEYNPGDVVDIYIIRNDKEMKLKCTLESRK
ncbi:MAG: M28 family peptidase [Bacteroidetes bacterium]|nr:MAG: M28 family peptidase [Bacteroidota bacterium]